MVKEKWDNKYDVKTVSAKLSQLDFVKFKTHCDAKGITPSKEIKNLIDKEIKDPLAINLAGKNQFLYNPAKDNFSWRAILDKGVISYIEDDLSFEFLKQLSDAINLAVDERNTFIQKKKEDSVSIPSKILRKGL
jgi:hypothetical protein